MSETGKIHCLFRSTNFGKLFGLINELVAHKLLVSYSGSPQQLTGCTAPSTAKGQDLYALCNVTNAVLQDHIIKTIVKYPEVTVAISVIKGELCQCALNAKCANARFTRALLSTGKPLPTFKGYQSSTNVTPPKSPTKDDDDDEIMDVTPDDITKANEFRTMLNHGPGPAGAAQNQAIFQSKQNVTPAQRAQLLRQQQFLNQQRNGQFPAQPTAGISTTQQNVNRVIRQQQGQLTPQQQQIIQQHLQNQQRNTPARQQQAAAQPRIQQVVMSRPQPNQQTRTVRLQPPPLPQRTAVQRSHPYQMPQRAQTVQPQRAQTVQPQRQQAAQSAQQQRVPAQMPVEKKQHISIIRAQEQLQQQLEQSSSRTPQPPSPQVVATPANQKIQPQPFNITVGAYLAQQAQAKMLNNAPSTSTQAPRPIGGGAIRTVLPRGRPPAQQARSVNPRIRAQVNAAVAKAVQHVNSLSAAQTPQALPGPSTISKPSTSTAHFPSTPGPSRRFSTQADQPSTSTGRGTRRKAPSDDDDYCPPDASTLADVRCSSSTRPKRECTKKKETAFYKEEADAYGDEEDEEKAKKKKGKNTDPAYDFLEYRVDWWKGYDAIRQKARKKPTDEEIEHYNIRTCKLCDEWVPKRQFFNHALELHGAFKRYRCEGDNCKFQTMFYKKAHTHLDRVHNSETRAFDWKRDTHYRAHACLMIAKCFPVDKVPLPLRPIARVLFSGCDRHSKEVEPDLEEPSWQDTSGPLFASGDEFYSDSYDLLP